MWRKNVGRRLKTHEKVAHVCQTPFKKFYFLLQKSNKVSLHVDFLTYVSVIR